MIRVLITDDSKVVRLLIRTLIEQEPDFTVVGEAENGLQAVEMTKELKPDVITMDIRMPVMDGFQATEQIMLECPTPILVVSASVDAVELMIAFNALEAGALGVIEKPPGLRGDEYEKVKDQLAKSLRECSGIKVAKRTKKPRHLNKLVDDLRASSSQISSALHEIVAIGCSTGGPALLGEILRGLPVNFPAPIVIVQHISEGFTSGLAMWLNDVSGLLVKQAEELETLRPGVVYIAPYGTHLQVRRIDRSLMAHLSPRITDDAFCPSVDEMFASIAKCCPGHALGVLLTGMGSDGAKGMLAMFEAGCYTIAQDEASSVVYGMPNEAFKLGAVREQLAGPDIAKSLRKYLCSVQDSRLGERDEKNIGG